jgi:hypothetical protein
LITFRPTNACNRQSKGLRKPRPLKEFGKWVIRSSLLMKFILDHDRINECHPAPPTFSKTAPKKVDVFCRIQWSLFLMIEVARWWHVKERN